MNATPAQGQSRLLDRALQHLAQFLRTPRAQSACLALMMLDRLSYDPSASDEIRAEGSRLADAIDALWRSMQDRDAAHRMT